MRSYIGQFCQAYNYDNRAALIKGDIHLFPQHFDEEFDYNGVYYVPFSYHASKVIIHPGKATKWLLENIQYGVKRDWGY